MNDTEPLVLSSMKCSFPQLLGTIKDLNFGLRKANVNVRETKRIPPDLASSVATFLTVQRVEHSEVVAVAASSPFVDSTVALRDCLVDDEDSWWLSGPFTMPGGRGVEYVEFQLCEQRILRRVTAVNISIPPLPQGPLSVREFRVDVANEKGIWQQLSFLFQVENSSGMQRFPIGDVDAHSIRIVCLSNQMSAHPSMMCQTDQYDRVGFYAVKFE